MHFPSCVYGFGIAEYSTVFVIAKAYLCHLYLVCSQKKAIGEKVSMILAEDRVSICRHIQCMVQVNLMPFTIVQFFIPPGTHHCWVGRGSMEQEVCPTLLHMTSSGNRTPNLLILSPTPYPLGHMFPQTYIQVYEWTKHYLWISRFCLLHLTFVRLDVFIMSC